MFRTFVPREVVATASVSAIVPWLRWVLLVPAAILAELVARGTVHALASVGSSVPAISKADIVVSCVFAPVVFVSVGVLMAPKRRYIILVILALLKVVAVAWDGHDIAAAVLEGESKLQVAPLSILAAITCPSGGTYSHTLLALSFSSPKFPSAYRLKASWHKGTSEGTG